MMSNGASGDINNIPFGIRRAPRAPFEQCRIVAGKTADACWRAIQKIETYDAAPVIATGQREVELDYRKPTAAEVKRAEELLKLSPAEREAIHKKTTNYANQMMRFAAPDSPRSEKLIIQAFGLASRRLSRCRSKSWSKSASNSRNAVPPPAPSSSGWPMAAMGTFSHPVRSTWAATRLGLGF